MRKARDATDSFDLFLDTVCNTFGGIVFLAILLAVMVQNRSIVKSPDLDGQHATPDQVRSVMAQLDDVSSKHQQLQSSLASMPVKTSSIDDTEFLELQHDNEKLKESVGDALANETQSSKELAEKLEINAEQRKQNETLLIDLAEARKLASEVKVDFQNLVQSKQQTLRLPKVRSSRAANILILVQDGAAYLAKTPSLFGKGFHDDKVNVTTVAGSGIQITPIAGAGWDLATNQGQADLQRVVQDAADEGHAMTIAIWPESFDRFTNLREKMIAAGVMYQLWPQSNDEQLVIFLGAGASNVQ